MKKYKFRAECLNDVIRFKWRNQGLIKDLNIKCNDMFPDVEVVFNSDLQLNEILHNMKDIPDSHVMAQTINEINNYTGIRNYDLRY